MKTLYLERSTGESRSGAWARDLALDGVTRIVVGMGPGSFAGIRSAIAFAQGYALGTSCEVLGLPSPAAIVGTLRANPEAPRRLAVVGDARQGKRWVALFDGYVLTKPVFQVPAEELARTLSDGEVAIVTPDAERIGAELEVLFGTRYLGEARPTEAGLRAFAEANPDALVREPLPIYLNPAVRT